MLDELVDETPSEVPEHEGAAVEVPVESPPVEEAESVLPPESASEVTIPPADEVPQRLSRDVIEARVKEWADEHMQGAKCPSVNQLHPFDYIRSVFPDLVDRLCL